MFNDSKNEQHDPNNPIKKGSFKDRVNQLLKGRSLRVASKDWGIPLSTLTSYASKGSIPSADKAYQIANAEGVTVEWLITGVDANDEANIIDTSIDDAIWNQLTPEDKHKLCKRIISKGVRSLDISDRDDRILALVADMSDEHFKEIYAFVHKAKYMLLAGLPIGKPADVDDWNEKRA